MTNIISISLPNTLKKDLELLQKTYGYSGRSEVIRTALRILLQGHKKTEALTGTIDALLLLIHEDKHSQHISIIRHKYQHIIKTQLHNHLENHKCLELFILKGNTTAIKHFTQTCQTNKHIDFTQLIIP